MSTSSQKSVQASLYIHLADPRSNANGFEDPDDPQIAFQNDIITRLIPSEHLPKLLTVKVQRRWLHSLAMLHDNERPEKRRLVDHIDISKTKAVLATDLLGGKGTLGIEIKVSVTCYNLSTRRPSTCFCIA